MATMQKGLRELREHIAGFMADYPTVACHYEPSQRHLEVTIIAPNGLDKKVRVSGAEHDPRARCNAVRDVKRAMADLNIAIKGEKGTMRPTAQQRVIKDFHDLVAENAKDLGDEIDTGPREESKPMSNGNGNGHDYTEAQRMRDNKVPITKIAEQTGIPKTSVQRHTAPPGKIEDARKERHQLNHGEVFKLGGLLMAHCACAVDTGFATYVEGWSDERIAREVSERCTADDVKKARMQHVGKTEAETPKVLAASTPFEHQLQLKVAKLTQRVDSLEGLLEALTAPGK